MSNNNNNTLDLTTVKSVVSTMGPNIQANNDASICKAVPDKVKNLHTTLNSCRSIQEKTQIKDMISKISGITENHKQQEMIYSDLILTGDRIFGSSSTDTMIQDITNRNEELKNKKETLEKEIKNNDEISEVENQDFIDELNEHPEPQKTYRLNVVEDYTVSVFSIAFIFMIMCFGFLYIRTNEYSVKSIGIAILAVVAATLVSFTLLNFLV